jgi:hypothetical protein
VGYDILLNEWPRIVTGGTGAAGSLEGGAEEYLHEAALAHAPPSQTVYDPEKDGIPMASLGVHEHWNNPAERLYSRNLGLTNGIELVYVRLERSAPTLSAVRSGGSLNLSWPSSYAGYTLQRNGALQTNWTAVAQTPYLWQGRNFVSNALADPATFYRLAR